MVSADRGERMVEFADPQSFVVGSPGQTAAILAWLDPEAMTKRIEAEVDALPEPALALSANEEEKRATELAGQLVT
jgi:hypothetical protein